MVPNQKTFYFLEHKYIDLIRNKDSQNVKLKLKLGNFNYIVGPYLKDGNHWCLFFVDIRNSLFFYCDPYIADTNEIETFFDKWLIFVNKRDDLTKENWKVGNIKHSPQSDNFNCGIIILMIVEKLFMQKYDLTFDKNSLEGYRMDLYEKIGKNSKAKELFCGCCGEILKASAATAVVIERILCCTKCKRHYHFKCYPTTVIASEDDILCCLCV